MSTSQSAPFTPSSEVKFARKMGKRLAMRLRELSQNTKPGWQPIETAPKDGTVILAFGTDGSTLINRETGEERPAPPRQAVLGWEPPNKYRPSGGWCLTAGFGDFFPEKWRPLPDDPA